MFQLPLNPRICIYLLNYVQQFYQPSIFRDYHFRSETVELGPQVLLQKVNADVPVALAPYGLRPDPPHAQGA